MKKIKVLHIIKSLGRGGAEMLLPETLRLHNKEKFEFHYIYFLPWKNQMVNEIRQHGGKVICLEAANNIKLMLRYKDLLKYCKENYIDVIHCHLPWAGFVGRLVFKLSGIPVCYTEHNMQERYHLVTKFVNKLTFNSQTLALGVSQDVTDSIRKNIKPKVKVETLLNGVNTEKFSSTGDKSIRKEFNISDGDIVIGNVAVFRFQKRLVEWLQVFKQISISSKKNVYGIIVGAGPLEKEVKAELKRLQLENKVFLPGLKTNVKPYFEAMDIFMMSSSFEGLPIALLEAMSMECAIVSTDAGGIKEVIRNEQDGLICSKDSLEDLAELAVELIKDSKRLYEMKVNARTRVKESFSLTSMVEKLETYYLDLSS